jgi:hypothetical protein
MATYSTTLTPLSMNTAAPTTSATSSPNNAPSDWLEGVAQAWGTALDNQANLIQQDANALNGGSGGSDSPSAITMLTTESLRIGVMFDSSHTSLTSIGDGLDAMARKQ